MRRSTGVQVVREDVRRVFSTYLLVSVFEAAALLASTVFVTLPLTIPRLLNVQLAVPLAAMEGARGRDAMRASKARMLGYRRSAAAMLGLVRPQPCPPRPVCVQSGCSASRREVAGVICGRGAARCSMRLRWERPLAHSYGGEGQYGRGPLRVPGS